MGCLLYLPVILLFILIFFGTAILRLAQALFGGRPSPTYGRQRPGNSDTRSRTRGQSQEEATTAYESASDPSYRHWPHVSRHKIFGRDEGEYIDFEEVKEN